MTTQSGTTTWWSKWGNVCVPIAVALIFFLITFLFFPFRGRIQFDADEGLNLMRSMLVVLGHPLYVEVSSDQPPLFTQLLGLLLRVTGFSVTPARVLVLCFSTVLVWAAAQFLQLTWGKLAAVLFLPLAILAPRYLGLSVSVMIGLPSISMAFVSMLFLTLWHRGRRDRWLVLSGFALALSILIKLFTGFLVPIFLVGMCVSAYLDGKANGLSWKMLRPALIWSLSFAGLALVLGLALVGPQNIWEIIYPHLMAPTEQSFKGENFTMNHQLVPALPLLMLGIFGVVSTFYRRNWLTLYPLAWAGLAYVLFSFYAPVFYHHQLLITIPIALASAGSLADGISALAHARRPADFMRLPALWGAGAVIGFVLVCAYYSPVLKTELVHSPRIGGSTLTATAGKIKVIHTMNEYADRTKWIVTDMPMYAFLVHKPMPPILATFSKKRLAAGSLTNDDILAAVKEYRPEQVLMARFVIPKLEAYLKQNYTLVAAPEFFRLFVRNDLHPTPLLKTK